MSYEDTAAVMEMIDLDLPMVEWRVLLALAHHKNRFTGRCDPSYARIALFARMSDGHIGEYLLRLRERGLISWEAGHRKNNKYTLHLDPPGEVTLPERVPRIDPPGEVPTCNQQPRVGRARDLPPRSGQRSGPAGSDSYSNGSLDDESRRFAETRETLDPKPPTPTLSGEEASLLSNIYAKLSGNVDLVENLEEFQRYAGPLQGYVIAWVLWWTYRLSNYWREKLQPTVGDFLRAMPTLYKQYENFCRKGGLKVPLHEKLPSVRAVFDQVFPPAPESILFNTEEEKTYLEGNVAVSPEDEVVLPKSKAFEIED